MAKVIGIGALYVTTEDGLIRFTIPTQHSTAVLTHDQATKLVVKLQRALEKKPTTREKAK